MNTYFVEVNSQNSNEYLGGILKLQEEVYEHLRGQGNEYIFFKSSEEEIREYIESEDSIVALLKTGDDIASVCYLTFGHSVYNDLTLYIRGSSAYKEYVFSSYNVSTLMATYLHNNLVYRELKERSVITDELLKKIKAKADNNDFFENDPLRQILAKKLVESGILSDTGYPWITVEDLPFDDKVKNLTKEYDEFISHFKYKYISQPKELKNKMHELTDEVVGELDTYFSSPKYRNQGYASTLIDWTIKRAISRRNIVALSATVHPYNAISQHILKNLGFETFCTVERRKDVLRDVMFKIID